MFGSKLLCRRLADRIAFHTRPTGRRTMVTGATDSANLVVSGSVKGDSNVRGTFTLSHSGRWSGNVEAENAVISGHVLGNLKVAEQLEIRKSARISGSVRARTVAIAEGAVIDSQTAIACDSSVIRFREKRKRDRIQRLWPGRLRVAISHWVSILLNIR